MATVSTKDLEETRDYLKQSYLHCKGVLEHDDAMGDPADERLLKHSKMIGIALACVMKAIKEREQ